MALTRVLNHNITDRDVTEIKFAEGLIDSLSSTITIENFDPKFNTVTITDNTFTAIDDTAVSLSGGYIVVNGENFAEGVTVIVDNTPAPSVNRVNSTTLQVQVPPKSAATYNLFVVNPDGGTAIKISAITYSANPSWVTASPLTDQTSSIAFAINFSAPSATSYALAAGSTLPAGTTLLANGYFFGTVTVGAETLFSFDVIATDAENQDASKSFSVSVINAPVVTSVQVANSAFTILDDTAVSTTGGFVVVNGNYFANGATVNIATTPATTVTFVDSTTLQVQVPAKSAASYNVSVINPDGRTGNLVNGLTYSAVPVWVTASPLANQTSDIVFSTNFSAPSATSYAVANGSSLPAGTSLLSNGYFFGTVTNVNDTTYSFDIVATDAELQDTTKSFTLSVINRPVVSSIAIANSTYTVLDDTAVNTGGGFIVITGDYFANNATVSIVSTLANTVTRVDNTTLRVQVPARAEGTYNVSVTNSDGRVGNLVNGLTYSAFPGWVTASPLNNIINNSPFAINFSAPSATSYAVANGSSLPSGAALLSNGYFYGTVTVDSDTNYTFDVVANDAENQDTSKSFTVSVINPPDITSIQITDNTFTAIDDTAVNTTGGYIIITGNYFAVGATVLIGGTTASSVSRIDSNTLRVQVPAKAAASYNVTVTNPNGSTDTLVNGITYSAAPSWVTDSFIRQVANNREFNTVLDATGATSYSVAAGSSLPAGTSLLANGYFYGTVTVGSDTTFTFSAVANDAENQDVTKSFSITAIASPREWWGWVGSSPVQIGTNANWSQVSGSYGVRNDGTLWSQNTQIGSLTNWAFISATGLPFVGIKTNGTLWTWGSNTGVSNVWGELGSNNRTTRSSPQQVGSLTNWAFATGASNQNVHAIKTDGTLWAWGRNTYGQLAAGLLISVHRSSPTQIGTDTNWSKVTNGLSSVLAIRTNGTLWAWGNNLVGNLGINSRTEQLYSPRQVGALTNWKEVSTNGSYTNAIKTDGTLWGWGREGVDSTIRDRSSPVQIGTDTNWNKLGGSKSALKTNGQIWTWYPNAPALASTTSKAWIEISESAGLV